MKTEVVLKFEVVDVVAHEVVCLMKTEVVLKFSNILGPFRICLV